MLPKMVTRCRQSFRKKAMKGRIRYPAAQANITTAVTATRNFGPTISVPKIEKMKQIYQHKVCFFFKFIHS